MLKMHTLIHSMRDSYIFYHLYAFVRPSCSVWVWDISEINFRYKQKAAIFLVEGQAIRSHK